MSSVIQSKKKTDINCSGHPKLYDSDLSGFGILYK